VRGKKENKNPSMAYSQLWDRLGSLLSKPGKPAGKKRRDLSRGRGRKKQLNCAFSMQGRGTHAGWDSLIKIPWGERKAYDSHYFPFWQKKPLRIPVGPWVPIEGGIRDGLGGQNHKGKVGGKN